MDLRLRVMRGGAPTAALAILALLAPSLRAQAPDVPVYDDAKIVASLTAQGAKLAADGRLVAVEKLAAQRTDRKKCRLALAPTVHEKLAPSQVCAVARRSTWVVGLLFHCDECAEWHLSGATGYAIAADGALATCAHVIEHDDDAKDEFVVAADPDGVLHPVVEVLAADLRTDTCIVRVDAKDLVPLALNPDSRPGDAVFCYGHPQHHFGFFSQGEIARFAIEPDESEDADKSDGPDPDARDAHDAKPSAKVPSSEPPVIVMEITAEFAAGSSGSPVLDECGNVVGHASATEAVFWDDSDPSATNHQMTLRIATVARDVLALIEPPAPPPTRDAPKASGPGN